MCVRGHIDDYVCVGFVKRWSEQWKNKQKSMCCVYVCMCGVRVFTCVCVCVCAIVCGGVCDRYVRCVCVIVCDVCDMCVMCVCVIQMTYACDVC